MENKKGRESKGEEGQERKEETIEKTWKTCLARTHQDFFPLLCFLFHKNYSDTSL